MTASKEQNTKVAGYADDLFGAGSVEGLRKMWNFIQNEGPKYGYYQEATKSWLIVKKSSLEKAKQMFSGTSIQITSEGRKHLGAIIGSDGFRDLYMDEKIAGWIEEIRTLSKIAQYAPQQAYTCFTAGYKHKLNYCMRTIGNIGPALKKVDDAVTTLLIPAITGGIIPTTAERRLFSLPPSMGGLGIPIFEDMSAVEYENSTNVTMMLQDAIIAQTRQYDVDDKKLSAAKLKLKRRNSERNKNIFDGIYDESTEKRKKLLEIISEKGASLWLTTLPIKEEGFQFNKQTFWDLMRIRYGYQLIRLPVKCACGAHFDLQHALSCKKGGFVTLRHNMVRDVTARLLKEVCHDVLVEPQLLPITGEKLKEATANKSDEARLDISARSFWITGQKAFLDVRVFNPLAGRYGNSNISKTYEINEKEKKRSYNERVQQIEHGSFTPLVFSATGGMGRECDRFYRRLCELLAEKKKEPLPMITQWVRRKLSHSLMKSVGMCLRGSRKMRNNEELLIIDSLSTSPCNSEVLSNIV